jgi:DNA mismatch endonuclease (patch repair protein)
MRSEVMSRIRGRDTKPERALRAMLHHLGYRFTVNGPKNKSLRLKNLLFHSKVQNQQSSFVNQTLFLHGCFWHGHENCQHFRLPKSRIDF